MRNVETQYIVPRVAAAVIGIPDIRLREMRISKALPNFGKPVGNQFVYSQAEAALAKTAVTLAEVGIAWRRGCVLVAERRDMIAGLLLMAERQSHEDYILTLTIDKKSGTCAIVDCDRSDRVKFSQEFPLTVRINISMILRAVVARVDELEASERRARPYLR